MQSLMNALELQAERNMLDGTQLAEVGSVVIDLSAAALIRLAVTSHEAGILATGVIDAISQKSTSANRRRMRHRDGTDSRR